MRGFMLSTLCLLGYRNAMNPTVDILRAIFALAFVVGLMWGFSYLIKKHGWRLGLPTAMTQGRTRRLKLVEILPLDHRNKVALVRQDDKEHLILIGAETSRIIEKNLSAPADMTEKL